MKKRLLPILYCLLLSSCATTAYRSAALNSWQGASALDLPRVWGPPQKTWSGGQDTTWYTYEYKLKGTNPTYVSSGGTYMRQSPGGFMEMSSVPTTVSGGGTFFDICKTSFEVDNKTGKILDANFQGNACAVTKDQAMAMANPRNLPVFG